ncbi:unnamed protein product [Haemonchus placei]|uniref:Serine/threonine protein kinase n=1 Tax=Haemonchus placei TaxID=6290 RepID=A0A0N4WZS3_HAEPC|nr:unnamed protein product [Haemonchus placei]
MPATRSKAASNNRAMAQLSDTKLAKSDPGTVQAFDISEDIADDPLLGRGAKIIQDATLSALTQVRNDTCALAAQLTQRINEGNVSARSLQCFVRRESDTRSLGFCT